MLSQVYRFHGHGSLRYVYKNGKSVRCRLFTIKFVNNPRRKTSRFSVVVSKKIAKSAVVRNRIRRRIYEAIRTHLSNINDVYDVVLIATTSELAMIDYGELSKTVTDQLKSANLLPSSDQSKSDII